MTLIAGLYNPNKKLSNLYVFGLLRHIAVTLITLFSPIYIFKIFSGRGFGVATSLIIVLLFYGVILLTKLVAFVVAENLSQKIGFKGMIKLSVVPYILNVISLVLLSKSDVFLVSAAIFGGLQAAFYWWGYHCYFVKSGSLRHFGESLGEVNFLNTLVSILAPLVGAVLVQYFGFPILFIFAIIFILASMLFLGEGSGDRQKGDVYLKDVFNLMKVHYRSSLSYLGISIEAVYFILVWPIFLLLTFGRVLDLGIVVSMASFLASIFSILIGRRIDNKGETGVLGLGSSLLSISWWIRLFGSGISFYIIAESFANFGGQMQGVSLNELTYKKAYESNDMSSAILFREVSLIFGGLIFIVLMIFWMLTIGDLRLSFIIPAIGSMTPYIYVFHKIKNANKGIHNN
jgi:MFS family permease